MWALSLAFLLLVSGLARAYPSPEGVFEASSNCSSVLTHYVFLYDTYDNYDCRVNQALESYASFLSKENTFGMVCLLSGVECTPLSSNPAAGLQLLRDSPDESGDLDNTLSLMMTAYASEEATHQRAKKKLVMFMNEYHSSSRISDLKRMGFEVFVYGNSGDNLASEPRELHRFNFDCNTEPQYFFYYNSYIQALSAIRGDKNYACVYGGFGLPHVTTFDETKYDLPKVGEFTLFSLDSQQDPLIVQVRQTARETGDASENGQKNSVELRAVALRSHDDELEITYDPVEDIVTFFNDGEELHPRDFDRDTYWDVDYFETQYYYYEFDDFYVTITLVEPFGGYMIEVQPYNTRHVVQIYLSNYGSYIKLNPDQDAYGLSGGLCGSYDGCSLNDAMFPNGTAWIDHADFTSPRSRHDEARDLFFESWRVNVHDRLFRKTGFEEYKEPMPGWKPLSSSPKGFRGAEEVCSHLPQAMRPNCEYDVGARKHLYASWTHYQFLRYECASYCEVTVSAPASLEAEKYCPQYCPYREDHEAIAGRYNATIQPEITLRGSNGPRSFFKPAIDLGGVYTFRLRANDLCDDQERNITVTITCDAPPTVLTMDFVDEEGKALPEDRVVFTRRKGQRISPIYQLFASVSGASNPELLKVQWTPVNASLPYGKTEETYPLEDRIDDAYDMFQGITSLRPIFHPSQRYSYYYGEFTFELSVSDGCQVTRKNLTVEFRCGSCPPAPRINPGHSAVYWQRDNSLEGISWPNYNPNVWSSHDADSTYDDVEYAWKLSGKTGSLVEYQGSGEYLVYKVTSPRVVVNQTTEVETSRSSNDTDTDNQYPYESSEFPYRIPELNVVTRTTTWSESTIVAVTTTTLEEQRRPECYVEINSVSSSSPSISFDDDYMDSDELARCPGYYTLTLEAVDECRMNSTHNVTDSVLVRLDCGLHPRAYASCVKKVVFDYEASQGFPWVDFSAWGTIDPRDTTNDFEGENLRYSWRLASQPAHSAIEVDSTDIEDSFRPDVGGLYTLEVTASNQCNLDRATTTVQAVCPSAAPAVTLASDSPQTYSGSGATPFDMTTIASHDFPSSLRFNWGLVTPALVAPEVLVTGVVGNPGFDDYQAANTTFYGYAAGTYSLSMSVSDRCLAPVTRFLNVVVSCPATRNTVATATPTSSQFDYASNTFPSITLDGTTSSITGTGYTASQQLRWYHIDEQGVATYVGSDSVTVYPGAYSSAPSSFRFRLIHDDGCNYYFRDVTFASTCPQNPTASAKRTTTGTIQLGDTVTLTGEDSASDIDSYQWYLVSDPSGSSGNYGSGMTLDIYSVQVGTYVFELVVSDGCKTASTTISFVVVCPQVNYSPAGTISASSTYSNGKFSRVEVDGRSSNLDGRELGDFSYVWTFVSAPAGSVYAPSYTLNFTESWQTWDDTDVEGNLTMYTNYTEVTREYLEIVRRTTLETVDNEAHNFSGCFFPDVAGTYVLHLTISEDSLEDRCYAKTSSTVRVVATCNNPPSIVASDLEVTLQTNVQTRVLLDATGTTDPNGDQLTFTWEPIVDELDESSPISQLEPLTHADTPLASFIPIRGGTYSFLLTVSDGCSTVTKTVTVQASCPYADEIAASKRRQREHEKDMIKARFDGLALSREAFQLHDSLLSTECVNEYQWELLDYSDAILGQTEKFVGSGGYIAMVVILVLVGVAILAGVAVFAFLKLKGAAGASSAGKGAANTASGTSTDPIKKDVEMTQEETAW